MLKSKSLSRSVVSAFAVTALTLVLSATHPQSAAADVKKGKATYSMLCFTCHGTNGEGIRTLNSPALSGLSSWYMISQLKKFKNGQRGAHPEDVTGAQMAPMAGVLADEAAMIDVSDYVRTLVPPKPHDQEIKGDATKGEVVYTKTCQECHGADGLGLKEKLSSALAGQNDWYLLVQLEKFKAGIRGAAEGDVTGAEMKVIADKMTEADMKSVIAYINTLKLPPREPSTKK